MHFLSMLTPRALAAPALALALAAAALAQEPAAHNAPQALVTGLEGGAQARNVEGPHRLMPLDTLAEGDELALSAGARVELVLAGAQRVVVLLGPGRFVLRGAAFAVRGGAGRIEARDLVGEWQSLRLSPGHVGRASISLRGATDPSLVLRAPTGGRFAAGVAQFAWEAPQGVAGGGWRYTLVVIGPDGAERYRATTDATVAQPPPGVGWQRGVSYIWSVEAVSREGRHAQGEAEFHVIAPALEQGLHAAQDAAAEARRREPAAAAVAEDVLLALRLDQAGLRGDADERWRRLAAARPELLPWSELSQ
jgi:hypothetical protein